jgi:VIT1/CCC1 family predicted Fe2+/Mn2+ transporter
MLVAFMTEGLIPLAPFLSTLEPQASFLAASILTFASLFIIGLWKSSFTGKTGWSQALKWSLLESWQQQFPM